MRTLRSRLILSHLLPFLIVFPLVSVGLVYLFESQILLNDLSNEIRRQGELMANLALNEPEIWQNSAQAQQFIARYSVFYQTDIRLLDPNGLLLASSESEDSAQIGLNFNNSAIADSYQVEIYHTRQLEADVVEVLIPVVDAQKNVLGVLRLSQKLGDVSDRFARFRYMIVGVLLIELALAIIIALILATNLSRYLEQVTTAINGVVSGQNWQTLPEQGVREIRELLRAFNTLINRLRRVEDSRRQLLANLVHEVGRPIGALQSAIQALLNGADEDPQLRRELLTGMNEQTQRLNPLLDSLSTMHGHVLGVLELQLQSVSLSDWLPRTVLPWREAAHAKGLHWQIDIPAALPPIQIDPDRMAQVLGNLLSNAIKYTAEGTISILVQLKDEGIAITISDTGFGIALDEQERIFEPFYRSQRERRFPQGMGLGLSITRDLVTAHGGQLWLESAPGKGSHFTIWLPV